MPGRCHHCRQRRDRAGRGARREGRA